MKAPDEKIGRRGPLFGAWAPTENKELLGVALIEFGLIWLGLQVSMLPGGISPIWPATGFGIWAVLNGGKRVVVAVALGAVLGKIAMQTPMITWPSAALGTGGEAWLGAWLIRRTASWRGNWSEISAVAGYVLAAVIAPMISTALGVGALVGGRIIGWDAVPLEATTWWMRDMMGALLLVPLLQAARDARQVDERFDRTDWRYAVIVLVLLIGVGSAVLFSRLSGGLIFLVFPLLLMGSCWKERLGARLTSTCIATIAIAAAALHVGPFTGGDFNSGLLRLHGFLISIVLTGLVLPLMRLRHGSRLPRYVLLAGWCASAGVYEYQQRTVRAADDRHLRAEVDNAQAAIQERMRVYIEALRSGEALFHAAGDVNVVQWRAFSNALRLRQQFPGINGIGVIWPVRRAETDAFLAQMRDRGRLDFVMKAVPSVTRPVVFDDDPEHLVIGYIEPEATNAAAVGLDVGSEQNRRSAGLRARDTGEPCMTRRIVLVQDGQKRAGFLLFLPVYIPGLPVETVEQRREAFHHWIYAPFVTELFLEGVVPGVTQELSLDFFEGKSTASEDLLYAGAMDGRTGDPSPGLRASNYALTSVLTLAGEDFTLGWRRTSRFASPDATTPIWISSGLALLTLAISAVVSLLQDSRSHAAAMVDKRTRELATAQEKMAALLGLQQAVLDGNNFSIIGTDTSGLINVFSGGAEKMLGYSRADILEKFSPELIHVEAEVVARAKALTLELGETINPGFEVFTALPSRGRLEEREWTYVRRDGSRFPVQLTISAIHNEAREVVGYVGIAQDLTQRKQAEASRKAAQVELTLLKQALDQHVEMSVADPEGRIEYANAKFCENSGYTADELIGQSHRILKSGEHPDSFFKDLWDTVKSGRNWRGTICNRTKDGALYWLDTLIVPECDSDGRIRRMVSVRTDVTRRTEYEQGLTRARDEAIALSRTKSEFLANISHELRTPMNGVIGMAGLLADGPLDAEQRHMINVIRHSGESLLTIINDILDLSKMEAGKMRIEASEFNLHELLQETTELLAPRAKDKGLQLRYEWNERIGFPLVGDPGRLRQVVVNLVGNAVKFTRVGSVTLRLHIGRVSDGEVDLRIEVEDTGCGIDATMQSRLFRPFVQVDGSDSRAHGGTGLGLAISRQIVELMGGRIGLDSELGRGATFWLEVSLPRGSAAALSSSPGPERSSSKSGSDASIEEGKPSYRILLVEDNPANQAVARILLRRLGHVVEIANNGEEGLAWLQRESFDVVLMDCQMPVLDGFAATRRLRSGAVPGADPTVPVVALTAYAMPSDRQRCLDAGMDDYLGKPLRPKEIIEALDRAVAGRSSESAAPAQAVDASASLPVIDEEIAAEFEAMETKDGNTLFGELAGHFLGESAAQLDLMRSQLHAENWAKLGALAHRFAGSAATLGGMALRGSALGVESAAETGSAADVTLCFTGMERDHAELIAALHRRLGTSPVA